MLRFGEIPCDILLCRKFVLMEDDVIIGGASLRLKKDTVVLTDWTLSEEHPEYADLFAGALLNAAANTNAEFISTPIAEHFARFGLLVEGLEMRIRREELDFNSNCSGGCSGGCGGCSGECGDSHDEGDCDCHQGGDEACGCQSGSGCHCHDKEDDKE